jgi:hypothetical protein
MTRDSTADDEDVGSSRLEIDGADQMAVLGCADVDVTEDLGTKLLMETDRVRIWEHRVPAGGTGPLHLHRRPYFSVVVDGTNGDTLGPDGAVLEHFTLTPGTVLPVWEDSLPQTHALQNTGPNEILIVTTELL